MRRLFSIVIFVGCLLCSSVVAAHADGDKLSKGLQKECKKTVKALKREGWTVSGVSQSIEKAIEGHFLCLEQAGADATVIEGNGKGKTVNIAVRRAMNNASAQYATMKGSEVEGRTEINITNSEVGDSAVSHSSLDASYVSSTSQKVKKFVPTVVLYKKVNDDMMEARAFYVVTNED